MTVRIGIRFDGFDTIGETKLINPGPVSISITFSEPVEEVAVKVGRLEIRSGVPRNDDKEWSGTFRVPDDDSLSGVQQIVISAKDKDDHYGDIGGLLDKDPKIPARRSYASGSYDWKETYKPGEDTNHQITIKPKDKPPKPENLNISRPDIDKEKGKGLVFTGKFVYSFLNDVYKKHPGTATITITPDMKFSGNFSISFSNVKVPDIIPDIIVGQRTVNYNGSFKGKAVHIKHGPDFNDEETITLETVTGNGTWKDEFIPSDSWFKPQSSSGNGNAFVNGIYNLTTGKGEFTVGISKTTIVSENSMIIDGNSFKLTDIKINIRR